MKKMKQYSVILLTILSLVLAGCSDTPNKNTEKERFVGDLLSKMTLDEKIGQMTLFTSGWDVTGPVLNENYRKEILAGRCGNLFNAHTVAYNRELQRMAVEETRLGIPLLFGYDVIHGYKTIFPIPLAEACSWDLELIEKSARLAAKEAAAAGLNWTFAPMADLARDPRWGRISEGAGEDPWLGGLIAAARTRGFQGDSLSDPYTLAACVKHFAAYGAPEGGRDYATVDLSERTLLEQYYPPYKAAIDAGAATVMTAFNEINGIPATGHHELLTKMLRNEWGFSGMVVTDYTSINEMVPHGYAGDLKHAGELAVTAGVDMDMQGSVYLDHLKNLVEEGSVDEKSIDEAARRVLNLKYELGLFEDPYRYLDAQREQEVVLSDEMMDHALDIARKSIVLLKNDPVNNQRLLPLKEDIRSIALIGPLADNREDLLGTWHAAGDERRVRTLKEEFEATMPGSVVHYARGCETYGDDRSGFADALAAARRSELVIMAIGENYVQNGEAASRSELGLPGVQQELLDQVVATGKPVVVLLMAGRPLAISRMHEQVPAIVNTWHPGTMAARAIADVLTGKQNPAGKLVVSFPRNEGQIPVYYNMKNTGRPFDANNKYTSKYLDVANEPLYPFGYGLSYTTFSYSEPSLSSQEITISDTLKISVQVTNSGALAGTEVVQLYIRDLVGSVTRPVKELKGFQRIDLEAGESKTLIFTLTSNDLRFYDAQMNFTSEPGEFVVMVGGNSVDVQTANFLLK